MSKESEEWNERDAAQELAGVARDYPETAWATTYAAKRIRELSKEARYWKSLYGCAQEVQATRFDDQMRMLVQAEEMRKRIAELEQQLAPGAGP
jgi:hypothetical protein